MFSLGEVRAAYIIMDGVNAREERKNSRKNGRTGSYNSDWLWN